MSKMTDACDFELDGAPLAAKHYLAHTVEGRSLRSLAREAGCHPSTILRQVRKVEQMRDDPLVDAALINMGAVKSDASILLNAPSKQELRILRRLCERDTVLAIGEGMDKAVVVRELDNGHMTRTAVIDVSLAEKMALSELIAATSLGKISRYVITATGRNCLQAFGEDEDDIDRRVYTIDPPIIALSRRRDRSGEPFLKSHHIAVAERIREDYEIASLTDKNLATWSYMEGLIKDSPKLDMTKAKDRLIAIIASLGPSMGEAVYRCCCLLEGLESIEKRKFWSARSGKIVLRIALECIEQQQDQFYKGYREMIG